MKLTDAPPSMQSINPTLAPRHARLPPRRAKSAAKATRRWGGVRAGFLEDDGTNEAQCEAVLGLEPMGHAAHRKRQSAFEPGLLADTDHADTPL